jgi:DNA-directed RNA polymerase subunit RPC12/RpoP
VSDIKIDIPVEIRCAKCGQKSLSPETMQDDSPVTCSNCEAQIGSWGDVKKAALQSVVEQIKKKLKDDFGDAFHPQ